MNDGELDEMLNKWNAPEPSGVLRDNVRASYRAVRPRHRKLWPRMFTLGAVAAALLVFVVGRATPQQGNVPYLVESEVVRYYEGGSDSAHITSYNRDGSEVMVSFFKPENLFATALGQMARLVHGMPRRAPSEEAGVYASCMGQGCFMPTTYWFVNSKQLLNSKCEAEGKVVGHETILGYATTAVENTWRDRSRRMILWRAPGLGCFALRVEMQARQPDGTYRRTDLKQALNVTAPGKQ